MFGNNSAGQLGLGTTDHEPLPKELPLEERVIDIAAGKRHSIILTERYVGAWSFVTRTVINFLAAKKYWPSEATRRVNSALEVRKTMRCLRH